MSVPYNNKKTIEDGRTVEGGNTPFLDSSETRGLFLNKVNFKNT
jgi:hypothetical protein